MDVGFNNRARTERARRCRRDFGTTGNTIRGAETYSHHARQGAMFMATTYRTYFDVPRNVFLTAVHVPCARASRLTCTGVNATGAAYTALVLKRSHKLSFPRSISHTRVR